MADEGTKVIVGLKGDSAADIARQQGFVGDDTEWVMSLEAAAADQAVLADASAVTATNAAGTATTKAAEAVASAVTATTAQGTATSAAELATTAATDASASQTAADNAAVAASSSQSAAGTSATTAATGATTATTKAAEAVTSATAAAGSQTAAAVSATSANASMVRAEDAADRAEAPTSEMVTNLLVTPGSAPNTALNAAIDGKIAALPPSAAASLDGALMPLRTRLWGREDLPVPLVFAGDSLTQGGAVLSAERWVTLLTEGWPLIETYATSLATGPNAKGLTFLNMGVGGINALNYIKAADIPTIAGWNPALVMHNIGTNDVTAEWGTPEWVAGNVEDKIDAIDAAATLPVGHIIVRPSMRYDAAIAHDWDEFLKLFKVIASTRPNVGVYDFAEPFKALDVPGTDPADIMADDKIHPNSRGNRLYYDTLKPMLNVPKFTSPVTLLSDDFNRADGALIGSSPVVGTGVWEGAAGDFLIEGGRVKSGAGSVRQARIEGGTNQDFDLYAEAELTGASTGEEVAFKALDSANHYTLNYSATLLRIRSYIGGVNTARATTAGITMTTGVKYNVHIRQRANVITATVIGVGTVTYDNKALASSQGTWSKVGFKSNSGGSFYDNLLVTKPGV